MPEVFSSGTGRQIDLTRPPAMLPQYLRAALPGRGGRHDAVPEVLLRLPGVRPDPADVARYAAVVGQPAGDRLPLLYPHLLGFGLQLKLMTDPAFPFPALGLVHVGNEVTVLRQLPLGSAFDVAVHVGAVRPHAKGRVVDFITEVRSEGAVVWSETSSYLRRGRPSAGAATEAPAGGAPDTEAPGTDEPGTDEPGTEAPGTDELPPLHFSARWRLPGDLGRRYAAVSGDVNPIHLSALTARPLGFKRAIAHGMWTAAAVIGALDGRLPQAYTYAVQFRRPILLPGTVRLFTAVSGDRIAAQVRGKEGDDRLHLVADVRAV